MENTIILFDFDGVLVDTIGICLETVHEYNPKLTLEGLKSLFMGNIFKSYANVKEPEGFDFQGKFRSRLQKLKPCEGVQELLKKLDRKNNIIISATHSDVIKEFLVKHDLDLYFSAIMGQDVEKSKEIKFQKICEKYPQHKFVFITDTVGDIVEGENFNFYTIAVAWGYQDRETLEQGKPDVLVDSFAQLYNEIIKQI